MQTSTGSRARRCTAVLLVAGLAFGPVTAPPGRTQEPGKGSLHGIIYQADGRTRVTGARALAVSVTTGTIYSSDITGENGAYVIRALPAGTYDVAFEVAGLVFVAGNLIDLWHGESLSLSFVIEPRKPANRRVAGLAAPSGAADMLGPLRAPAGMGPFMKFWTSNLGIAFLGALSFGVGYLIADDDPEGSPSSP